MSSFLSILLIAAVIGLTIFGWWYNSPKQKGKRGEMRIQDILLTSSMRHPSLDFTLG